MRSSSQIGISDAFLRWSNLPSTDKAFAFMCQDGSGNDLTDSVNSLDTGDYSGTTTNLWAAPATGLQLPGDGGYRSTDSDLLDIIDFTQDGTWVIAVNVERDTPTGNCIPFAFGTDGVGPTNTGSGGGKLTLKLDHSNERVSVPYRDGADADDSSPNQPDALQLNFTTGGLTNDGWPHHVALLITVSSGTMTMNAYVDNVVDGLTQTLPDDLTTAQTGLSRPFLQGLTIGGIFLGASGVSGDFDGNATTGHMKNFVIWKRSTVDSAAGVELIDWLYKHPGEPIKWPT